MIVREIDAAQRIAILETQVIHIMKGQEQIKDKLDELLLLRSKGMGVFWLASILFGTGITGVLAAVLGWIKG